MKETMQNKRLELMIGIAEKELSGLTSIHNELSSTLGEKLMDTIDLIEKVDGNVVLSGIGKSGMIANKIADQIYSLVGKKISCGYVDVTFYRDDFLTNIGSHKIGPS